jgi:hypothetical protein
MNASFLIFHFFIFQHKIMVYSEGYGLSCQFVIQCPRFSAMLFLQSLLVGFIDDERYLRFARGWGASGAVDGG